MDRSTTEGPPTGQTGPRGRLGRRRPSRHSILGLPSTSSRLPRSDRRLPTRPLGSPLPPSRDGRPQSRPRTLTQSHDSGVKGEDTTPVPTGPRSLLVYPPLKDPLTYGPHSLPDRENQGISLVVLSNPPGFPFDVSPVDPGPPRRNTLGDPRIPSPFSLDHPPHNGSQGTPDSDRDSGCQGTGRPQNEVLDNRTPGLRQWVLKRSRLPTDLRPR